VTERVVVEGRKGGWKGGVCVAGEFEWLGRGNGWRMAVLGLRRWSL